ncbi:MAG: hypothetical protein ACYC9O_06450 [Candidatus Latescibacterota bacterium]
MPGRCIFTICVIFTLTSLSPAWAAPLTDCEALDQLLSGMIRTSFSGFAPNAGKTLLLDYPSGSNLQKHARNTAETAISAAGHAITEGEYDYRFSILIHDIRCTLTGRKGTYDRFISMTAYITCTDHLGATIFARRFDEQYRDRIEGSFLEITNTAGKFSGDVQRNITGNGKGMLKTVSFVILATALAYFSIRL